MTATAFPLQWPSGTARAKSRGASRYKVKPATALDEMLAGLRLLGATGVVVSSNAPVRRDGRPYAEALSEKHSDPGVAVYFTFDKQQVVIACDAWIGLWENVRAIGMTVEGMRAIQRSGATDLLRRAFTGFKMLEGPRPWYEVLGVDANATPDEIAAAHRRKAIEMHPDRGGSHDAMSELNVARDEGLGDAR